MITESDSASCSLVQAKDPLVLDNTASRASSFSWRWWDLLHSFRVEVLGYSKTLVETPSVFVPEDSFVAGDIIFAS